MLKQYEIVMTDRSMEVRTEGRQLKMPATRN